MHPELVLIGHLAQDLQPDGSYRLGGTVTYAALLATRLGLTVGVVTSAPAIDCAQLADLIPGIALANVPALTPTIFENRYTAGGSGHRQQFLRARAAMLDVSAVPLDWRVAPITLLGPIAAEIAPQVAACLHGTIRAATPQGWLRAWDATGAVSPIPWHDAHQITPHLDALILSTEDLAIASGDQAQAQVVRELARSIPTVVLTDGPRPAQIWIDGNGPHAVAAFPATEHDPTGAGDCFAIAFLIDLWRNGDPLHAARFAHAAAAFVVESPGITGIPTAQQIAARMTT